MTNTDTHTKTHGDVTSTHSNIIFLHLNNFLMSCFYKECVFVQSFKICTNIWIFKYKLLFALYKEQEISLKSY